MKAKVCIVPLELLEGYAYVEYFQSNTFGNQVKLYNVFSKSKLTYEQLILNEPVEMVPRILMNGETRLRKYKEFLKWEKLIELEIDDKESKIWYKSGGQNQLVNLTNWSDYDNWVVFNDVDFKKKLKKVKPEDYSSIENLPFWTHYNYIGVTEKIQMYWAKKRGNH